MVDAYMAGQVKVDEYITHTMKFEEINKAFELLHKGECLRCVLQVGEIGSKKRKAAA